MHIAHAKVPTLKAKKTPICPGLTPLRDWGERRFTLARAGVILGAVWVLPDGCACQNH